MDFKRPLRHSHRFSTECVTFVPPEILRHGETVFFINIQQISLNQILRNCNIKFVANLLTPKLMFSKNYHYKPVNYLADR